MRSETRTRLENIETVLDDRSDRLRVLEGTVASLEFCLDLYGKCIDALTTRLESSEATLEDTRLLAELTASVLTTERNRKAKEGRADERETLIKSRVCDCCKPKAPPPEEQT